MGSRLANALRVRLYQANALQVRLQRAEERRAWLVVTMRRRELAFQVPLRWAKVPALVT